jgi:hypothetical protein
MIELELSAPDSVEEKPETSTISNKNPWTDMGHASKPPHSHRAVLRGGSHDRERLMVSGLVDTICLGSHHHRGIETYTRTHPLKLVETKYPSEKSGVIYEHSHTTQYPTR